MIDHWSTIVAAALPALLGATFEKFQIFLEPLQEFRTRANSRRKILKERLAEKHADLLSSIDSDTDDLVRGWVVAPKGEDADKFGPFTDELFRTITLFARIERLTTLRQRAHDLLLTTTVVGFAIAVVAGFVEPARFWLMVAGLSMAAVQILTVVAVHRSSGKLNEYDDLT